MNVSLKPAVVAMLALAAMTAGCSDDPVEPETAPPPTVQGSTWAVTSNSFTANGISGFLMTFDTSSLDVVGIQYTIGGTLYSYDEAQITGAAGEVGFTWAINAEWGASTFEFGGTMTSSGNELVGGSVWTINEPTGNAADASTATFTRQ